MIVPVAVSSELVVRVDDLPPGQLDLLKAALSFKNEDREKQAKLKVFGWWDLPETIDLWREEVRRGGEHVLCMPRGFAAQLGGGLADAGATVQWNDQRSTAPAALGYFVPFLLRPYQADFIAALIAAEQGVGQAPTGSGKTTSVLGMMALLQQRSIVIVDKEALAEQWRERAAQFLGLSTDLSEERSVGKIGKGVWEERDLTICLRQTLFSRQWQTDAIDWASRWGLCVVDECFPAGTLIDGKAIETINVGDEVCSYDEQSGSVSPQTVKRLFCKRPQSMVKVVLSNGQEICCTSNHPFWTEVGWVQAQSLAPHMVLSSSDAATKTTHRSRLHAMWPTHCHGQQQSTSLLRQYGPSVLLEGVRNSCSSSGEFDQWSGWSDYNRLHMVWRDIQGRLEWPEEQASVEGTRLLLEKVQRRIPEREFEPDYGSNQQEVCLRANDASQSHEGPGSPCASDSNASSDGPQASCARRQWQGYADPTTDVERGVGLSHHGAADRHRSKTTRMANTLQDRHCESRVDDRSGGRWSIPQRTVSAASGSPQGRVLDWVGVDRVEVLERGSDGTFGGVCSDGLVYNLEVDGPHTYFADDVVVHNCHHLGAADTVQEVVRSLPCRYMFGVSATPARSETQGLIIGALVGPLVARVERQVLVDAGILVHPTLRVIETAVELDFWPTHDSDKEGSCQKPGCKKKVPHGHRDNWQSCLKALIEDEDRNRLIAEAIVAERGHVHLVPSRQKKHLDLLEAALVEAGWDGPIYKLRGKENAEGLSKEITDAVAGSHEAVLLSTVADEGLDVPPLDRVWMVFPIRQSTLTIQTVGRVERSFPGKTSAVVVDVHDPGCIVFDEQHRERMRTYRSLGLQVEPKNFGGHPSSEGEERQVPGALSSVPTAGDSAPAKNFDERPLPLDGGEAEQAANDPESAPPGLPERAQPAPNSPSNEMVVLICGSRGWGDRPMIERYVKKIIGEVNGDRRLVVIHGGARGADTIAGEVAADLGVEVRVFEANWERGKSAGFQRNIDMLDEKPERVAAFSLGTSGTRHTVEVARERGIPVDLHGPKGLVKER